MSNVVISNRSIFNQRITSIDKNKVNLPFNVTKEQINKIVGLLSKVQVAFQHEVDNLKISKLFYNNMQINGVRKIADSRFTLSKSYIVTMKQAYVSKVVEFYNRVVEEKVEIINRPSFDVSEETNLQQALKEATAELDLSELQQKTNVVLANSQMENKELKVDSSIIADNTPVEAQPEVKSVEPMTMVNTPAMTSPIQEVQADQQQPVVNQQPVLNEQMVAQPEVMQTSPETASNAVEVEQPKVKRKLFSKRGNILVVPIIVLWLGLVLFGSIKLVTMILT